MISERDMESLSGTMGEDTKETGRMESKMAKGPIFHLMEELGKEFGRMEKELDG